jgi:serine phosphatase RsbU (regulator of sigma subunit)
MPANNPSSFHAADGEMTTLKNTGIPLGLFDDQEWQQRKIQLNPDDLVVI